MEREIRKRISTLRYLFLAGGGGGRDEVWDREAMFSQLAKWSPSVVVSG